MQGNRSRSRSPTRNNAKLRLRSPVGAANIHVEDAEEDLTEDQIIEIRRRKRELLVEKLTKEAEKEEITVNANADVSIIDGEGESGIEAGRLDGSLESNHGLPVISSGHVQMSGMSSLSSEDDMFSSNLGIKVDQEGQRLDQSLLDNWDDIEGYYRIIAGELIDERYLVTKTLGRGVFAAVVRAEDQTTKQTVAIKIIRNNETMRTAGQKEIEMLKTLNSADTKDDRHVVRLLRTLDFKNHLCLVFENLGSNLRDVLKKFGRDTGINIMAVRSYAYQAIRGLDLLRECQIVHADLKPDNMLVDESHNLLKLADLGSAIHISEETPTPYLVSRFYRAPELILGTPYDYGVDMWSLGCSLFELYSGNILFSGRNNNHMLKVIMEACGVFSHKMLRKGKFTDQHFNERFVFVSHEVDRITENPVEKQITNVGPFPKKKLSFLLNDMESDDQSKLLVSRLIDLLDKMLTLNPEKRITPKDALKHAFIVGE
jgi:serine/threonine-protein kinase PRP4